MALLDVAARRSAGLHSLLLGACLAAGNAVAAPVGDFPAVDETRASAIDLEAGDVFRIPEADERPTLPTAGPFFDVRDIEITGIEDRPALGLRVEELRAVARAELARQADEQEIRSQGYSDEELLEVARYLDRVRARRNDEDITKIAYFDELVDILETFSSRRFGAPRENRLGERSGLSVFDLEAVASAVQSRIRETGLVLAQVVVPPQRVADGVVELRVYPGRLGEVRVARNSVYEPGTLVSAFDGIIDEPVVVSELDERLRLVNDLGGIDISGVFVPGAEPGTTRLRLDAVNERRWSFVQRYDNHGAVLTGRRRGLFQLSTFDLTGAGDELTAAFLRSEPSEPVTLGSLRYSRPAPGLREFLEAGIAYNEFAVGGATDIQGETLNLDLAIGRHWVRTRDRNLTTRLEVAHKDTELLIADGTTDRGQSNAEVGLRISYDTLIPGLQMIVDGSTAVRAGVVTDGLLEGTPTPRIPDPVTGESQRDKTAFNGQPRNFFIANQDLRLYKLFDFPVPFMDARSSHSVLVRVNAQYTEQFLPSVNRFALGGAQAVRSLLADDVSVDKGVIASMQLFWDIPEALDEPFGLFGLVPSEALRPYVFYDYGYGVTNATRVDASSLDDTWFEFAALGAGVEYSFGRKQNGSYGIRGSVNWARPEKSRFGDSLFETIIEDEDRIYADITLEIDQNDWPYFFGRRR